MPPRRRNAAEEEQRQLKKRLMRQLEMRGNDECADCTTRGPRWASVTL